MAGPATALVPVTKAVEGASKVLTGDLVVFRGKIHRRREQVFYGPDLTPKTGRLRKHTQEVLEPIDVEFHVSPLGIGLGAAALAVAGLAGIIAWNGIRVGLPLGGSVQIFEGFKETKTGQLITEKLSPEGEIPTTAPMGEKCQDLHDRWRALRADPFWFANPASVLELHAIEKDAGLLECAWLTNP